MKDVSLLYNPTKKCFAPVFLDLVSIYLILYCADSAQCNYSLDENMFTLFTTF